MKSKESQINKGSWVPSLRRKELGSSMAIGLDLLQVWVFQVERELADAIWELFFKETIPRT